MKDKPERHNKSDLPDCMETNWEDKPGKCSHGSHRTKRLYRTMVGNLAGVFHRMASPKESKKPIDSEKNTTKRQTLLGEAYKETHQWWGYLQNTKQANDLAKTPSLLRHHPSKTPNEETMARMRKSKLLLSGVHPEDKVNPPKTTIHSSHHIYIYTTEMRPFTLLLAEIL